MEWLKSELPAKAYLSELKASLMSPFALFRERVTGFVWGPFFAVAHHSDYEWDRRFNMVCSRAWGYVKKSEEGAEIRFLRWHGFLTPFWLFFFTLLSLIMNVIAIGTDDGSIPLMPLLLVSIGIALVICVASAIGSVMTERGETSQGEITRLLKNPEDYYC